MIQVLGSRSTLLGSPIPGYGDNEIFVYKALKLLDGTVKQYCSPINYTILNVQIVSL